MEWQMEAYMWDELAFNCDILQGGGGDVCFVFFKQSFIILKTWS